VGLKDVGKSTYFNLNFVQKVFKKKPINKGKQTKLTHLNPHLKGIKYAKIRGCILVF